MSSHASSKTGTDRWGRAVRTDTAASVFGPDLLAALEFEQVSTQHCWLFLRARTSTWCRDKLALSWVNASGGRQINALVHIPRPRSTGPAGYSGVRGQATVVLFLCYELSIQDILRVASSC